MASHADAEGAFVSLLLQTGHDSLSRRILAAAQRDAEAARSSVARLIAASSVPDADDSESQQEVQEEAAALSSSEQLNHHVVTTACPVCALRNPDVPCSYPQCNRLYHEQCLPELRKRNPSAPLGEWVCPRCRFEHQLGRVVCTTGYGTVAPSGPSSLDPLTAALQKRFDGTGSLVRLDGAAHDEECSACGQAQGAEPGGSDGGSSRSAATTAAGELVLCDGSGCKRVYHVGCDPELSSGGVPEGEWLCPHCRAAPAPSASSSSSSAAAVAPPLSSVEASVVDGGARRAGAGGAGIGDDDDCDDVAGAAAAAMISSSASPDEGASGAAAVPATAAAAAPRAAAGSRKRKLGSSVGSSVAFAAASAAPASSSAVPAAAAAADQDDAIALGEEGSGAAALSAPDDTEPDAPKTGGSASAGGSDGSNPFRLEFHMESSIVPFFQVLDPVFSAKAAARGAEKSRRKSGAAAGEGDEEQPPAKKRRGRPPATPPAASSSSSAAPPPPPHDGWAAVVAAVSAQQTKEECREPPKFSRIARSVWRCEKPKKPRDDGADGQVCACNAPKSGSRPAGDGRCGESCQNRASMEECTRATCCFGEDPERQCANRDLQRRNTSEVSARPTPGKGWGLFADTAIPAGTFILEYVGEVLDDEGCGQRMAEYKAEGTAHFHMMEISRDRVIDAGRMGNNSRFINHSCAPNCGAMKITVGAEVRIGIVSLQPLPKGTELTYDYQFVAFEEERWACLCGSEKCRGFLGVSRKELNDARKWEVSGVGTDLKANMTAAIMEAGGAAAAAAALPRRTLRLHPRSLQIFHPGEIAFNYGVTAWEGGGGGAGEPLALVLETGGRERRDREQLALQLPTTEAAAAALLPVPLKQLWESGSALDDLQFAQRRRLFLVGAAPSTPNVFDETAHGSASASGAARGRRGKAAPKPRRRGFSSAAAAAVAAVAEGGEAGSDAAAASSSSSSSSAAVASSTSFSFSSSSSSAAASPSADRAAWRRGWHRRCWERAFSFPVSEGEAAAAAATVDGASFEAEAAPVGVEASTPWPGLPPAQRSAAFAAAPLLPSRGSRKGGLPSSSSSAPYTQGASTLPDAASTTATAAKRRGDEARVLLAAVASPRARCGVRLARYLRLVQLALQLRASVTDLAQALSGGGAHSSSISAAPIATTSAALIHDMLSSSLWYAALAAAQEAVVLPAEEEAALRSPDYEQELLAAAHRNAVRLQQAARGGRLQLQGLPPRLEAGYSSFVSALYLRDDDVSAMVEEANGVKDGNDVVCAKCYGSGDLLCCDGCACAYHLSCVGLNVYELPSGRWLCPKCKGNARNARMNSPLYAAAAAAGAAAAASAAGVAAPVAAFAGRRRVAPMPRSTMETTLYVALSAPLQDAELLRATAAAAMASHGSPLQAGLQVAELLPNFFKPVETWAQGCGVGTGAAVTSSLAQGPPPGPVPRSSPSSSNAGSASSGGGASPRYGASTGSGALPSGRKRREAPAAATAAADDGTDGQKGVSVGAEPGDAAPAAADDAEEPVRRVVKRGRPQRLPGA